jgi:hypothetical protein
MGNYFLLEHLGGEGAGSEPKTYTKYEQMP